jgi:integrase/recombinase XerD
MFCCGRFVGPLEDKVPIPAYCAWLRSSVLGQSVDAYVDYLQQQQYRSAVIRIYLRGVAHFARWVTKRRVPLRSIDESLTRQFLTEHLPACRCPYPCLRTFIAVRAALVHLLHVLRTEGYISEPGVLIHPPIWDELERFDEYLGSVCGLAIATRASRRQWVSRFLTDLFAFAPIDIGRIQPHDIVGFMARTTHHYRPGSLGVLGCALRSYLRFRAVVCGDKVEALLAAVLCIARWPLDTVPKHLTDEEVVRFLGAFDQHSANGLRDFAMARCLLDMGLRAGEVAAIQLDDLNWRDGTLTIRYGKSRRADVLPLPTQTGRAIVQYVRVARPPSTTRTLFVRHRAPCSLPITRRLVSGAICRAFGRCGLTHCKGTHVLRHTAAVRMRCAGASLKEIADVLRHRSLDSATIYSKVDLPRLATVAAPWPGGLS